MKSRLFPLFWSGIGIFGALAETCAEGTAISARNIVPNLVGNVSRPLRYHPDGLDFVIENGSEYFNRSLYGGDTAFRIDGGDKPEFSLYLPGRGGNLRLGIAANGGAIWLSSCSTIKTRYRPGELLYELRDPFLGANGFISVEAVAYYETEGIAVRVACSGTPPGLELIWAYGGVNGERGARDGDIGTERVPISEYFQLQPKFCKGNLYEVGAGGFTLTAGAAKIAGVVSGSCSLRVVDAREWHDPNALLGSTPGAFPVITGRTPITSTAPTYVSLQRIALGEQSQADLATYREVSADRRSEALPNLLSLAPRFLPSELSERFHAAISHFDELRTRVSVETPDPFLNAAVGALNVSADALWDEPQNAIMHGAIAWRTKLLGWRGPYALDDLGWHQRARANALYWASRQNTGPIQPEIPLPSEETNLARNERALHSNGDISWSHYDMNLVYVDAAFRHILWTGDRDFLARIWPTLERHLAWERRLFRREYGPSKLPLYEAYAAIWASDNLEYGGGGTAHASAYNYSQNLMAARFAPLVGADPRPYSLEAGQIARAMRSLLWLPKTGGFAEYKDFLGLQLVHPSGGLWTFYNTMDSGLPTAEEAWQMCAKVDRDIPHLPVEGPGVPRGLHTLSSTNWMPYEWSLNNVVFAEALHTALAYWQAGRPEEAWRIAKGTLMASMYMGISPGNVGTMSYLDVFRRESQRDFGDGAGVMSRAIVEGLFGVRPDAMANLITIAPGFPESWDYAVIHHPDLAMSFHRTLNLDTYKCEPAFSTPQRIHLLVAVRGRVRSVLVNGAPGVWRIIGLPEARERLEVDAPESKQSIVSISWEDLKIIPEPVPPDSCPPASPRTFLRPQPGARLEVVDLAPFFNDRVTRIFQNEYRAPRSRFTSLSLPKQGIGAWAGDYAATARIDDSGLRALSERGGGRIVLPNGVPLATPGQGSEKNIVFTSRWDNYGHEAIIPLKGRAIELFLMMAGSTNPMQSRIDNGEVIADYLDGSHERLALRNPETWWPIEQDYFTDDFQFRMDGPMPIRIDLQTGEIRILDAAAFKGIGRKVQGGSATVLTLQLDPSKELKTLTVRTLANDVVIGLMSATLVRSGGP
jgi:Domain of unknown function (DUF4450)